MRHEYSCAKNHMPQRDVTLGEEYRPITWDHIQSALGTLRRPEGGYSLAQRGLITTSDGKNLFVKIGVDTNTQEDGRQKKFEPTIFSRSILIHTFQDYYQRTTTTRVLHWTHCAPKTDGIGQIRGVNNVSTRHSRHSIASRRSTDLRINKLVAPTMTDENNGWPKLVASEELYKTLTAKLSG